MRLLNNISLRNVGLSVISLSVMIITSWLDNKKMDEVIEMKVREAIEKKG